MSIKKLPVKSICLQLMKYLRFDLSKWKAVWVGKDWFSSRGDMLYNISCLALMQMEKLWNLKCFSYMHWQKLCLQIRHRVWCVQLDVFFIMRCQYFMHVSLTEYWRKHSCNWSAYLFCHNNELSVMQVFASIHAKSSLDTALISKLTMPDMALKTLSTNLGHYYGV